MAETELSKRLHPKAVCTAFSHSVASVERKWERRKSEEEEEGWGRSGRGDKLGSSCVAVESPEPLMILLVF